MDDAWAFVLLAPMAYLALASLFSIPAWLKDRRQPASLPTNLGGDA